MGWGEKQIFLSVLGQCFWQRVLDVSKQMQGEDPWSLLLTDTTFVSVAPRKG